VRILHWLEISNFKSYRSSGRMPLEGQVRRFGGFASVALRKLVILDAAGCLNDLSLPPGNRLEPLRSAPLSFLRAQLGLLAVDAVQPRPPLGLRQLGNALAQIQP